MTPKVTFTSVRFYNFKALDRYSISLDPMNILVGPNNSGKSTLLSAFRVLEIGLRRANARKPDRLLGPDGPEFGYQLSEELFPISLENVHTDYSDTDSRIDFRLSNTNHLILYFPTDGGCRLFTKTQGRKPRSPTTFSKQFPISVGVVPVLGPVEHEEEILDPTYVRRHQSTHRASRHFRNYWYHFPDGFEQFSELVQETWPGMTIQQPERISPMSPKLAMFCTEHRITRELYWAGFGFQVWCQILTHVSRADAQRNSLLVIDEPEIYLHPNVQRQLLAILRDAHPDVLIGTHSTEIMAEADPAEILLVDKAKQSAQRLRDAEGVQQALDKLGSIQNITLTRLARNRKLLFVEGSNDFSVLRRFARKLGLSELAGGADLTALESGGFHAWEKIKGLSWGFRDALGRDLRIAVVFDRDYRSSEEVSEIADELSSYVDVAHLHDRKELENYLLVPDVLERALDRAIDERASRTEKSIEKTESAESILDRVSQAYRSRAQGQYVAKRRDYLEGSATDPATIATETIEWFDSKWRNLDTRMHVAPGKDVLKDFRSEVQAMYSVNLTDYQIVDAFRRSDVPHDLQTLIQRLERFRSGDV